MIDTKHGVACTVNWCLSKREKIDDAVADLRCRERTTNENIAFVRLEKPSVGATQHPETEGVIVAWARKKNLDAVVWTALKSNFKEKVNEPFTLDAVVNYFKTLPPEGKVKAAEYVWRSPGFVKTAVRSALQQEPWFSKPGNR